jgi:hypothetical protein
MAVILNVRVCTSRPATCRNVRYEHPPAGPHQASHESRSAPDVRPPPVDGAQQWRTQRRRSLAGAVADNSRCGQPRSRPTRVSRSRSVGVRVPGVVRRGGLTAAAACSGGGAVIPAGVRFFVCTQPVDMRYGFDRLAQVARERIEPAVSRSCAPTYGCMSRSGLSERPQPYPCAA